MEEDEALHEGLDQPTGWPIGKKHHHEEFCGSLGNSQHNISVDLDVDASQCSHLSPIVGMTHNSAMFPFCLDFSLLERPKTRYKTQK